MARLGTNAYAYGIWVIMKGKKKGKKGKKNIALMCGDWRAPLIAEC